MLVSLSINGEAFNRPTYSCIKGRNRSNMSTESTTSYQIILYHRMPNGMINAINESMCPLVLLVDVQRQIMCQLELLRNQTLYCYRNYFLYQNKVNVSSHYFQLTARADCY